MKTLVLAPQPFYQERGTPIAVRLALETLSRALRLTKDSAPLIDLLVYAEGQDIEIPGVRIIRLKTPQCLNGIRPGISRKKLLCDLFFLARTFLLLWRARKNQYRVIHAVEESVFVAWLAKQIFRVPYIYDMDSSLALQVTEKWRWCKPLLAVLRFFEGVAVRGSLAVAPVCDALEAIAHQHGSTNTVMLRDVSLLPEETNCSNTRSSLFGERVGTQQPVILYVGNLESYQGIDLLLESFALIKNHAARPHLVVVGGDQESIRRYQEKSERLACSGQVSLLGPKPLTDLRDLLVSADILVSPRIKGNNTPMKIYSYLHSGTPLVATDLPTHRQVLDDEVSILVAAEPGGFADGLARLLDSTELRHIIGERARRRAQSLYTVEAFEKQLSSLYARVANGVGEVFARQATISEG
jgi:glycosyltransferase involved in cell wall biosynthesis